MSPTEVERRIRGQPRWARRTIIMVVLGVAIPVSFFDRLAREWRAGLRMAVLDVQDEIAEARRLWRG